MLGMVDIQNKHNQILISENTKEFEASFKYWEMQVQKEKVEKAEDKAI